MCDYTRFHQLKKRRKKLKHRKIQAPAGSVSRKGRKQTYWTTSRKLALKHVYLSTIPHNHCMLVSDTNENRVNC